MWKTLGFSSALPSESTSVPTVALNCAVTLAIARVISDLSFIVSKNTLRVYSSMANTA